MYLYTCTVYINSSVCSQGKERVEELNELGELRKLLSDFPVSKPL